MPGERELERFVERDRERTAAARIRSVLPRVLICCLCVASASCADDPPPPPSADTETPDPAVQRLNAASSALKKEERKLYLLKRDLEPQEKAAAYHVFSTTLPSGLTLKGLHTDLDPRRGGESINFEEPDDRTDAEKDNLEKVREFANKFAAECRQPDSPTAKKVAAEINALPVTKELQQQQALVDKLQRERNEAQAAMPADKLGQ